MSDTPANFDVDYLQLKELLRKPGLVYLLIYSKTCPPCVQMKNVFDWMATSEYSKYRDLFQFVRLDIEKNFQIIGDIVTGDTRPMTIVFKDGKNIYSMAGMPANLSMDAFIERAYQEATKE